MTLRAALTPIIVEPVNTAVLVKIIQTLQALKQDVCNHRFVLDAIGAQLLHDVGT